MTDSTYVKLLIRRKAGEPDRYLTALRTTADYYGWSEEFPVWAPETIAISGRYELARDPGRKGRGSGGANVVLRICRSPVTAGNPKGKTNAFRVSKNCTLLDLAEIAHFTKGDWYWMTGPFGERISRERWEDRYAAGK